MSRVVLVTGCSTGGIGFSLCEEFARQGCKVYATSRRVESIGEFKSPNVEKLGLDVNNNENIESVLRHIQEAEGKIDIVVNNAGLISPGPLIDQDIEQVKKVFDTNVYAILRMSKAVIPIMAKRRSGLIVNVGSIVGEIGTPWNGIYCASKAAVANISDVLSMECKPLNISVMHLALGAVRSNISANAASQYSLAPESLYASYLPNIIARMHASQGLGSIPTTDCARQVVAGALASRPPQYMTLGGNALLFTFLKWLPKGLALFFMWRKWSKKM